MGTFVYVDGFNLYYRALKGTPWKWLDLVVLFERVLEQHHDIRAIKYFTARVSETPADQSKPQRQNLRHGEETAWSGNSAGLTGLTIVVHGQERIGPRCE